MANGRDGGLLDELTQKKIDDRIKYLGPQELSDLLAQTQKNASPSLVNPDSLLNTFTDRSTMLAPRTRTAPEYLQRQIASRQMQIDTDPARFVQDHPVVLAAQEARKRSPGAAADRQYYAAVKNVEDYLGIDPTKQRLLTNTEIKTHLQILKSMAPKGRVQYLENLKARLGVDLLPQDLRRLLQIGAK
jgi:hypothetical protein